MSRLTNGCMINQRQLLFHCEPKDCVLSYLGYNYCKDDVAACIRYRLLCQTLVIRRMKQSL